jgi:integrase
MSVFKRGTFYWFSFNWRGRRIQQSTKQKNRQAARDIEAAYRTNLSKGEVGIVERAPVPTFAEFSKRFAEQMESDHADKPKTLSYYQNSLKMLARYQPLRTARIDRIDKEMIAAYVVKRRAMKKRNGKPLKIATVNRELECLRRLLRLAADWNVIAKAPKISRQPGEIGRERILNHGEEQAYLAVAKQPLRDIATAIADDGFRPEEVFRMRWEDIRLKPAGKAQYGWIHVPFGKTKYAKRNVSMTQRVRSLLEMRWEQQGRPSEGWVFPAATASGHTDSVKSQHARALKDSGLAPVKGSELEPIVLYSFRHTMLTRLGEAGADAFAIQKIAGHSSVLVSQKYVHPTAGRIEDAFTALEAYNAKKEKELKEEQERSMQ